MPPTNMVPDEMRGFQNNLLAHPWYYYDNPYPANHWENPAQQSQMQELARLQTLATKLGPLINSPQGRRNAVMPGQVVRFNYAFFKPGHDPQPLVLVATDDWKTGHLHGINLHYLTFPKAQELLQTYCDNGGFNYRNIMGQEYITEAYRTYRWIGVQRLQYEHCAFLKAILNLREFMSPGQMTAVIQEIRRMAAQIVAPVAAAGPQQAPPGAAPQAVQPATPGVPTL